MALEIRVTLRLYSKNHALSELVNILGEPSKGFSIGDTFSKGKKTREHTFWSFDSSNISSKKCLDEHIKEILFFF